MRPEIADHGDAVDSHRPGRQFESLSRPGQIVRSLPLNLLGRVSRRYLNHRARQRANGLLNVIGRRDLRRLLGLDPSVGVECIAARTQTNQGRYPLGKSWTFCTSLVAGPTQTIKIPVASGSSVPACPTFELGNIRATWLTRFREVMPVGLLKTRIPETALLPSFPPLYLVSQPCVHSRRLIRFCWPAKVYRHRLTPLPRFTNVDRGPRRPKDENGKVDSNDSILSTAMPILARRARLQPADPLG